MADWWTRVRNIVTRQKVEDARSVDPNAPMREPPEKSTNVSAASLPSYLETMHKMTPAVIFTVGLVLTIFAERIGHWAMLGYLLLTCSPILAGLQRIEKRLKDLIDVLKRRG